MVKRRNSQLSSSIYLFVSSTQFLLFSTRCCAVCILYRKHKQKQNKPPIIEYVWSVTVNTVASSNQRTHGTWSEIPLVFRANMRCCGTAKKGRKILPADREYRGCDSVNAAQVVLCRQRKLDEKKHTSTTSKYQNEQSPNGKLKPNERCVYLVV